MIRLGIDESGADINVGGIINGINETVGTNNFYFNSIYIGGSAVSSGTSNSFALNSTITVNVRNYLNNIFIMHDQIVDQLVNIMQLKLEVQEQTQQD